MFRIQHHDSFKHHGFHFNSYRHSTGCQSTDQVTITGNRRFAWVLMLCQPNKYLCGQTLTTQRSASGGAERIPIMASNLRFWFNIANPMLLRREHYVSGTVVNGFNSVSQWPILPLNPLPNTNAGNNVAICSGELHNPGLGGTTYYGVLQMVLSDPNISNPLLHQHNYKLCCHCNICSGLFSNGWSDRHC